VRAQLLAQRPNVNVDRAFEHERIVAKRHVDQVGSCKSSARLPQQSGEQTEFAWREFERPVARRCSMPAPIDHDPLAHQDVTIRAALLLAAK
jgi:hypothetical protein